MTDDLQPAADAGEIAEPLTGWVVAQLGGKRLRIDVNVVREVVPEPVVTPLPLAPALVAGVINLRGDIIAVLDPSTLIPGDAVRIRNFAVVVEHDSVSAAILVEGVEDVAWLTAAEEQHLARLDVAEMLTHPDLQALAEP